MLVTTHYFVLTDTRFILNAKDILSSSYINSVPLTVSTLFNHGTIFTFDTWGTSEPKVLPAF